MFLALSVATAYLLTNIDALFTFLALSAAGRLKAALIGLLVVQAVVITGSFALGGAAASLTASDIGLLGIVPVALGFREILKSRHRAQEPETPALKPSSILGGITIFLALSADTFVLMSAFFAETRTDLQHLVLLGCLAAVAMLLILGLGFNKVLKPTAGTERFFARLAPLVMIAAGVYILMDTQTDML
ncbi:MAG: hypothetical protein ABJL55_04265 [Roseibium sp.]